MRKLYRQIAGLGLATLGLMSMEANAQAPLRIRNFREVLASYSSLTGVSARDSEVVDVYRAVKDRLPRIGLPEELSSSTVMALTELGGLFCLKAINREKILPYGERLMFADIDFARGASQFSPFLRGKLASDFGVNFWNRNPTEMEKRALDDMILGFAPATSVNPADTLAIVQGICTTFATSMAFLVK